MSFFIQVAQWFGDPAHWQGAGGIPTRLGEHILMSVAATATGALVALPVGILLGHWGRFGGLAVNISNVGGAGGSSIFGGAGGGEASVRDGKTTG